VNSKQLGGAILLGAAALFGVITSPMLFEDVDSSDVVVIQHPISGELKVVTEPGWTWQGFGSVTTYHRRNEFKFGTDSSPALNVRFYDGGTAQLHGSVSWLMPTDHDSIVKIHRDFRGHDNFELQAIRRSMESASTFSGPTMTSFESAAGRRNELLTILNDQTANGVYQTNSKLVHTKDLAGIEKDMTVLEIVHDAKGIPVRSQNSYVKDYNVALLPMTISKIDYERRVETQIKQQQDATNAAVVAKANAARAEQDALTAAAQGQANATKAEWEQKTTMAKAIAQAQAQVTIADAQVKEAEAFKKSEILRGEGEAARKAAVMSADGALDKKLAAYERVSGMYADAIAKAQPGAWAPGVQMGGAATGGGERSTSLVDLLTVKTARDLALDMDVGGRGRTKK
jgi:hypothetical protein